MHGVVRICFTTRAWHCPTDHRELSIRVASHDKRDKPRQATTSARQARTKKTMSTVAKDMSTSVNSNDDNRSPPLILLVPRVPDRRRHERAGVPRSIPPHAPSSGSCAEPSMPAKGETARQRRGCTSRSSRRSRCCAPSTGDASSAPWCRPKSSPRCGQHPSTWGTRDDRGGTPEYRLAPRPTKKRQSRERRSRRP